MDALKHVIDNKGKGSCSFLVVIIVAVVLFVYFIASHLLIVSSVMAFEFDSTGYGFSGGGEATLSDGWPSKDYNYGYGKVFAILKKNLSKNWYLNVEPGIGLHRAWNDTEDKLGLSVGVDGWFCYNLLQFSKNDNMYIGIGVGAMGMIPSDGQPELSNSGVLGMFGGRVGYRHRMEKSRLLVDVSVGVEHLSDPFHDDDAGRNFVTGIIGLKFLPKKGE